MTNVYVIGIGLIGGSMALDIKAFYPEAKIYGIDANEKHIQEAIDLGIVEAKADFADLINADWVIVSVPVDVALTVVPKVLDHIGEETVVFEVGSTKRLICEAVADHPKRRNYIATHPIAGTEFSGPSAAILGLFEDKANIICEVEKTAFKLQEKALDLFRKLGMRIRYMAGSGFESTVRLAKSSPEMWTPIFKHNKKQVVKSLDEYINNLSKFRELLESENYEKVFEEMQSVNKIKEILNGIKIKKQ